MVNRQIRSSVVDVVGLEGQKGPARMSLDNAIALAEQTGEDVVCVNPKSEVPIVRIMEYDKYIYEKQKKEKENKKKNRQTLKEIQISDSIMEHDLLTKAKNIDKFINAGDKVRLVIRYKGRAIKMIQQGPSKLQALANKVTANYIIEKTPLIEGNRVTMIIAPEKKKKE